ncbi:translocation/assembly module TamB domain-containing protein [Mesonia sp. HuA40]|uniref:translocation/assembly module TamB domain-containing protein n=1 Tax=Mesonia sp. HuA40 TaxID=2602761 RepID=UPI0011CBA29A|nr:translocation/assembly module TamB domain-containing protein [Mesonia sp. HuA40]TXK71026.1 translocation/assembly module TamB [Mesonia sp. HuA40]
MTQQTTNKEKAKLNKKGNTALYKRILRFIAKFFLVIFILFVLLLLFIRSPWGQNIIVNRVVDYVSGKTKTVVQLDKLFITWQGNINLEGLYLEDKKGDTLLYTRQLEADIPLYPILSNNNLNINALEWDGALANIKRKDTLAGFNFQFLIEAFADSNQPQKNMQPENKNEPLKINLGDFYFSDFNFTYQDAVLGSDLKVKFNALDLSMQEFDLEKQDYFIDKLHFQKALINYVQSEPQFMVQDSTQSGLPHLKMNEIRLKEVRFNYLDKPNQLKADVNLINFLLSNGNLDLNQQKIQIDELRLVDSKLDIDSNKPNNPKKESKEVDNTTDASIWPDWEVSLANIDFKNNQISYHEASKPRQENVFNPQAMTFKALFVKAKNLNLKRTKSVGLQLERLAFKESSGFKVKEASFVAQITDEKLKVNHIKLGTNTSNLKANIQIDYTNLDDFINDYTQADFRVNVSQLETQWVEAYYFAPELKQNKVFSQLGENPLQAKLKANGNLNTLNVEQVKVYWGDQFNSSLEGVFSNINNIDQLEFDLPIFEITTRKSAIEQFIKQEDLGFNLPDKIELKSTVKGSTSAGELDAFLDTSLGSVQVEGEFNLHKVYGFEGEIKTNSIQLAQLLDNEDFGNLSFTTQIKAQGEQLNNLDALLKTNFTELSYANYDFSALSLTANIKKGKGNIFAVFQDDNLNFEAQTQMVLDSVKSQVNFNLHLEGANLYALGLTDRDIRTKFDLSGYFKGNMQKYQSGLNLDNTVAVYDNRPYYLDDLAAYLAVDQDNTLMSVASNFLQINLDANDDPNVIDAALRQHINQYRGDSLQVSENETPVKINLTGRFKPTPIFKDIIFDGIKQMDSLRFSLAFNEEKNTLKGNINLPHLNYSNNKLSDFKLVIEGNGKTADLELGFGAIEAGPFQIGKTKLLGNYKDEKLYFGFQAFQEDNLTYNIQSVFFQKDGYKHFKILPEDLKLEGKNWQVPAENEVVFNDQEINVQQMRFKHQEQVFKFYTERIENDFALALDWKSFKIENLFHYLNPKNSVATGLLDGEVKFINPLKENALTADLEIANLHILENEIGNLKVDAQANDYKTYDLLAELKGDHIEAQLEGDYTIKENTSQYDFNLNLERLDLQLVQKFANSSIKEASGEVAAQIKLSQEENQLAYKGNINFLNAQVVPRALNTPYKLGKEKIGITKEQIDFNAFTIKDERENQFVVNGQILTKSLFNPEFDLSVKAQDFLALNANEEDNDLFFGKAIFDLYAQVKGDLNFPKIQADLNVKEGTAITYIYPNVAANRVTQDGVVVFVNKQNPDNILTQNAKAEKSSLITGLELKSKLLVESGASFKVILDERTNDNLEVVGQGELLFNIFKNGRTTLTGRYNISDGHYEMNLYNLVKRRFDLADNSSISWVGDPTDAQLDVTAIYEVKTSASTLMASQTSNASLEVQNQFKQRIPFQVYLNVEGELLKPKLNFRLGIPEDQRGAFGGALYGRINQLNQQEDALNKQIFSLLVLNRFYPSSGSDGSSGGPATVARDNINDALSDQLNVFSEKLVGDTGIDLDFGLNSYTDYQGSTSESRTDLNISASKKLFNDRLIVQAGSQVGVEGDARPGEENPVIGNVSIEYLISPSGRWRLRGFRKSEYENVIDGQVFVSGIALIFNREFNQFRELFKKELNKEKTSTPAPKKENEQKSSKLKATETIKEDQND